MTKVYDLEGNNVQNIDLPVCFETDYRPHLIQKAVNVMRANRRQPYGTSPEAGHYVAESFGPGRGIARVPRIASGRGAFMPGTVKGRRAGPPKAARIWQLRINKKEILLAKLSALSATAKQEIVTGRGHVFEGELPLIIEDAFEALTKTKEVVNVFEKLGLQNDVMRAKNGKHVRAGRGKNRGRKYKEPKSVLIVAANPENIKRAASNLSGVDVVGTDELNVEHLAPGGHAGRLTLYTVGAVSKIGEYYGSI